MSLQKLFDYTQPLVAGATILALGLIATGGVAGYTAYQIKVAGDTVQVTGSARETVTSDFARWTIMLDTTTGIGDQQAGLNRLTNATERIVTYLKEQGLEDVETPAAYVGTNYTYPERSAPILTGYTVSRQIIVRSADIDKVTMLADSLSPLTGSGYNVTTSGIELTYKKLDETRVTLLAEAIKDARARAESIAKDGGKAVGSLKSAASGVVQVLPAGGVDISDYGMYDTQSKEKEVMVTVRATFTLK